MKIWKKDIFINVQNENIQSLLFLRNRDFSFSLINAVKMKI